MARKFCFVETSSPDKTKTYSVRSSKMYKSRITKWGFDRKYVRSKGGQNGGIGQATRSRRSTAIPMPTCPSPTPALIDTHVFALSPDVPVSSRNYFPAELNHEGDPPIQNLSCGRPQKSAALTQVGMYDSSMSRGFSQTGSLQTRICRPPSPLPDFRIPEQIFGLIHSYVPSVFVNRIWVLNETEVYNAQNQSEDVVSGAFYHTCRTAVLLFNQNSYVQAQQVLSKAFGMIAKLLKAEEPRTLRRLWNSFAILIQNRLVDVALMLRRYICDMASLVLAPNHPLVRMWKLLSTSEPAQLEALVYQIWQCTTNAFARATGQFNQTTVSYQTELIYRIYGKSDPGSAERRLHSLLQECESQCGTSNFSYLHILTILGYNLLDQGKYEQAETTSNHLSEHARATAKYDSVKYQISAICIAVRAHYGLGQFCRAERGLREAVKMIAIDRGENDTWRMELMALLVEWLREWGRTEDADHLACELAKLSSE